VGDRRELDLDVEDRVRCDRLSGPALLAEGGDGSGSCLEQGGCLHFDVVGHAIEVLEADAASPQRGHGRG
jgi:hypothetical protein